MCIVKVPKPPTINAPTVTKSSLDAENTGIRRSQQERDLQQMPAGAPSLRINLGSNSGSGANLG